MAIRHHIEPMLTKAQWRRLIDSPVFEWTIFVVGLILLFVVAPLIGALPGPGGIIVAGIGLSLVLKTSLWAKKRYVRFKRWQPKAGGWTDWALRRGSAKRRRELEKQRQSAALDEGPAN